MASQDHMRAARNDMFSARVMYAALRYANTVMNEDPSTANHDARVGYAKRVIRGEERPRMLASFALAAVQNLRDAIDNQPAKRGDNISDVNLDTAMAAIWNARANAYS